MFSRWRWGKRRDIHWRAITRTLIGILITVDAKARKWCWWMKVRRNGKFRNSPSSQTWSWRPWTWRRLGPWCGHMFKLNFGPEVLWKGSVGITNVIRADHNTNFITCTLIQVSFGNCKWICNINVLVNRASAVLMCVGWYPMKLSYPLSPKIVRWLPSLSEGWKGIFAH